MLVENYLNSIMPRVPGAEETLVRQEILAAVRQFCDEGLAWDYNLGPIDVPAAQTMSLSTIPTDTKIVYLLRTEFKPNNSDLYHPFPARLTLAEDPAKTAEEPTEYYADTPSSLILSPIPTVIHTNGFRATVALIPTALTTVLPDVFETTWFDAIKDGVLARLHGMTSKPWSNSSLTLAHGRSFRNQIARARNTTKQRYGAANSAWMFPFFAA